MKTRGPQAEQLQTQARVELLERGGGQAGHHRRGDDRLRDDDGGWRVDQAQHAERAAAPQENRNYQPDDDRRQRHAGVDQAEEKRAPGELSQCKTGAQRQADQQTDGRRQTGDSEGKQGNLPDLRVAAREQKKCVLNALPDQVHDLVDMPRASKGVRGISYISLW